MRLKWSVGYGGYFAKGERGRYLVDKRDSHWQGNMLSECCGSPMMIFGTIGRTHRESCNLIEKFDCFLLEAEVIRESS